MSVSGRPFGQQPTTTSSSPPPPSSSLLLELLDELLLSSLLEPRDELDELLDELSPSPSLRDPSIVRDSSWPDPPSLPLPGGIQIDSSSLLRGPSLRLSDPLLSSLLLSSLLLESLDALLPVPLWLPLLSEPLLPEGFEPLLAESLPLDSSGLLLLIGPSLSRDDFSPTLDDSSGGWNDKLPEGGSVSDGVSVIDRLLTSLLSSLLLDELNGSSVIEDSSGSLLLRGPSLGRLSSDPEPEPLGGSSQMLGGAQNGTIGSVPPAEGWPTWCQGVCGTCCQSRFTSTSSCRRNCSIAAHRSSM